MTVHLKLTIGFVAVILLTNAVFSLVNVHYLEQVWLEEIQNRVRLDLNSARSSYGDQVNSIALFVRTVALHRGLIRDLKQLNRVEINTLVQRLYHAAGTDILCLLDQKGTVLWRAHNPGCTGDDLSRDALVAKVLKTQKAAQGTVVFSDTRLLTEGKDLAVRARFDVEASPSAHPTNDKTRSCGMIIGSVAPIFSEKGDLLGMLYAGNLLNRRYEIVDAIRAEVFPAEYYHGKSVEGGSFGTVTVFQDDLRIATNVFRRDGSRAIGTRLSAPIADRVLRDGQMWADPAQVLGDWYFTAYEPIRDPNNKVIGALYVGLLQAPFLHRKHVITVVVLTMVLVTSIAAVLLVVIIMRIILRPIRRIGVMAQRIIGGDQTARIGVYPPGEMGIVCRVIDRMADVVNQRQEQLERISQEKIDRVGKLALVGRLATDMAQDVSLSLATMVSLAQSLRDKPFLEDREREDLDLLLHETSCATERLFNLRDFAQQGAPVTKPVDLNQIALGALRLVRGQRIFQRITIDEELQPNIPLVEGDANQLEQVFVNLALNACEAMSQGGAITIRSFAHAGRVAIQMTDTGAGIKKEHLDKIFEPFFTSNPNVEGTGLGLCVAYDLVQKNQGNFEVESLEGQGTTFTVSFPLPGGGKST